MYSMCVVSLIVPCLGLHVAAMEFATGGGGGGGGGGWYIHWYMCYGQTVLRRLGYYLVNSTQ